MPDAVTQDVSDGVLTITMNWPDRLNVLGGEMVDGLAEAFDRARRDSDVRCVVFQGAGRHFCAGGDIRLMRDWAAMPADARREQFSSFISRFHVVAGGMQALPKPVVASLHGAVAGAGLSLAMGSDLAVAADDAVFTLAYIGIGASPDGGGTYSLPRIVGLKKAMEIAMLGDRFDAGTALSLGLVNRVVPAEERERETRALAARLARGPRGRARSDQGIASRVAHVGPQRPARPRKGELRPLRGHRRFRRGPERVHGETDAGIHGRRGGAAGNAAMTTTSYRASMYR